VTARLAVEAATVRFGATVALDDVDLRVEPGETVVVLGASGSGKSTLLRSIAGLQSMDEGRVLLDGVDVTARPTHRRGIGMMFQDHALFPHLDVGANVAFGPRMAGMAQGAIGERVAGLLEMVGLPRSTGRSVQTLSGGEQQRVALARALAADPAVLLLDEPLGALDRPLRERLVGELRGLFARLGVTVVAVTHDLAEAFVLADRLVVLHEGQVLQAGAPAEVWARPATAQVAALLGFRNVLDLTRSAPDDSPWGDLGPASTGAAAVLVRAEGVRVDPSGPVEARVEEVTFVGSLTRIRCSVAGAPDLEAHVAGAEAPSPGSVVRLRIDPEAVVSLRP